MLKDLLYLVLAIAAFPAAMFVGCAVGAGISKLLPSKSDIAIPVCAIIALVVTCILIFGGSSPGDTEQWFRP
jgi:hypothetical protein